MEVACKREAERLEASAVMQRLSYPTETVLSNEITRDRIVLSFKDSPRKPLGQRPLEEKEEEEGDKVRRSTAAAVRVEKPKCPVRAPVDQS